MYNHWLAALLAVIWYNINIFLCFLSICPTVFSQQGEWGGRGGLEVPGRTQGLEAAANRDICLAHWLMSERSPRVIRFRNFLNDWHSSLREETKPETPLGGAGGRAGPITVEGAGPPRNVPFTQLGV